MDFKKILFNLKPQLSLGFIFLLSFGIFFYLQPEARLIDPDSFYHTKLTTILRDWGILHEFPWTQSSLYRNIFTDYHLGYHLLLIPFLSIFHSDLLGIQVATIFFASLTITTVIWCLYRWRVPWWGIGALLLLTAEPLLFRLSLAKAPSIGVGAAILGYYLITQRRITWLFWWSWFFVWLYGAWPLLLVMAIVFIAVDSLSTLKSKEFVYNSLFKIVFEKVKVWIKQVFDNKNKKLLGVVLLGCLAGLVINPYFPTNIIYLKQLFTMALVAYHSFIGIGAEWYPPNVYFLLNGIAYLLIPWLLLTIISVANIKKQTNVSESTWILVLIFIFYTLRARRQVEYLVPFFVLSSALMWRDNWVLISNIKNWKVFYGWLPDWIRKKWVMILVAVYLLVVIPWGMVGSVLSVRKDLQGGYGFNVLRNAAGWLKNNTPANSIVFQSDWGTFPLLWYDNTHNLYLTGVDQTFMYEYDHEKHKLWVEVTKGKNNNPYNIAHDVFNASYYLLEKKFPAALVWINKDKRFKKVYQDSEVIIFAL